MHDTGPGIPAEGLGVVFDEFQRLDRQSPWGEKGLGLGLSICRAIAEMHGGSIDAANRLGGGAVFVVTLEAEHPPATDSP